MGLPDVAVTSRSRAASEILNRVPICDENDDTGEPWRPSWDPVSDEATQQHECAISSVFLRAAEASPEHTELLEEPAQDTFPHIRHRPPPTMLPLPRGELPTSVVQT